MELVPQSMAATRLTVLLGGQGARPGGPPLAHLLDGAVTDRVDPGAGGQGVPGQGVQALDPVGHSAGGQPRVGSTSRASRVAR